MWYFTSTTDVAKGEIAGRQIAVVEIMDQHVGIIVVDRHDFFVIGIALGIDTRFLFGKPLVVVVAPIFIIFPCIFDGVELARAGDNQQKY